MNVGDYSYDYVDGDFTVATPVAKPRKIYPVDSDSSIYILEQDYMQFIDFYEPLAPATKHDTLPNTYFLKDTPIRDVGNGVGFFTRTYSVLPGYDASGKKTSYVSSDYESFVFTVPGIDTTNETSYQWFVDSHYSSGGNLVITADGGPHDIATDMSVNIYYNVQDPLNNITFFRMATRIALDGTGGSTLVVRDIKDINTIDPTSFHRAATKAEPYQKTVASRIDKDYWLPGVTGGVDSPDEIPIIQAFEIIDNTTGNRTEYLSNTTIPTITQYRQSIEDDEWLVAEPSILRRWQGSDIIERATRYIRYTL